MSVYTECTSSQRDKILNDVYQELNVITGNAFAKDLKPIVTNLCAYSKRDLAILYLKLKKINTLGSRNTSKLKTYKRVKALLSSINTLNDADTHPIGLALSIKLYSAAAQKVLNVKHLDTSKIKKNAAVSIDASVNLDVSFEEFVVNILKLKFCRVMPVINYTILYSNPPKQPNCSWIRIRMKNSSRKLIVDFIKNHPEHLIITSMHSISPTIIEVYYNDTFIIDLLNYLNTDALEYVEELIFYSNLKLFKSKCLDHILTFSNILKFLYCYGNTSNDFSIRTNNDLTILNKYFLLTSIFMYKNNMSTGHGRNMSTPISVTSTANPKGSLTKTTNILHDISDYNKAVLQFNKFNEDPNKQIPLNSTAISQYSATLGLQHSIYGFNHDRDYRISGLGSKLGGNSIHELCVPVKQSTKADCFKL